MAILLIVMELGRFTDSLGCVGSAVWDHYCTGRKILLQQRFGRAHLSFMTQRF